MSQKAQQLQFRYTIDDEKRLHFVYTLDGVDVTKEQYAKFMRENPVFRDYVEKVENLKRKVYMLASTTDDPGNYVQTFYNMAKEAKANPKKN